MHLAQKFRDHFNRLSFFWRFQIVFWCIYGVASFPIHFAGLRYAAGWSASFTGILVFKLVDYSYGIAITSILGVLYNRPSFRSLSLPKTILTVCAASGALVLLDRLVMGPLLIAPVGRLMGQFHRPPGDRLLLRVIVTLWFFLFYAGWSTIYLLARASATAARRKEQIRESEIKRQFAELSLLRAQMNPHFLFNAMNTITSESQGNEKIDKLVGSLSDYLRYSLSSSNRHLVPLEEELNATRQYLEVEKGRFGDSLQVAFEVETLALPLMVPGILLQPLVENAVKHGRETSPCPLSIRVNATYQRRELILTVANSGKWKDAGASSDASSGIGLANIRQRLEILYPGRFTFDIAVEGPEVIASIRITDPETLPLGSGSR